MRSRGTSTAQQGARRQAGTEHFEPRPQRIEVVQPRLQLGDPQDGGVQLEWVKGPARGNRTLRERGSVVLRRQDAGDAVAGAEQGRESVESDGAAAAANLARGRFGDDEV